MPIRKEIFANEEIYHITLRALDNNLLLKDKNELYRAIYGIYEFNNANHVSIRDRREQRLAFKKQSELAPKSGFGVAEIDKRRPLVSVLAFALMPNHIHLLIRQLVDRGISIFMQKFGSGFATFFKEKYGIKKKGHFYQDRFNAVHIENDRQLQTVFAYIHTNPVALVEPGWKEKGILDPAKAKKFLEEKHRWSSYWDCLGKKNFPSVTQRDFLLDVMGGVQGCRNAVNGWIDYKGEIRNIPDFVLE